LLLGVEQLSFLRGKFGTTFERLRFMKILAMALPLKVSTKAEEAFLPSLYSSKVYFPLQPKYKTLKEIDDAIAFLEKFPGLLASLDIYLKYQWYISL
jgi:hypothetical protein